MKCARRIERGEEVVEVLESLLVGPVPPSKPAPTFRPSPRVEGVSYAAVMAAPWGSPPSTPPAASAASTPCRAATPAAPTPAPAGSSATPIAVRFTAEVEGAQTKTWADASAKKADQSLANFVDNAVRYEATLRFINGSSRTILSAIQGQ